MTGPVTAPQGDTAACTRYDVDTRGCHCKLAAGHDGRHVCYRCGGEHHWDDGTITDDWWGEHG